MGGAIGLYGGCGPVSMVEYGRSIVCVVLGIVVVAIVMKFVGVVAHPVPAHGVDGRGRCEPGQVYFTIEERHHVRNMTKR